MEDSKVVVNSLSLLKSYSKHTVVYMVVTCIPLSIVCFKVYLGVWTLTVLFTVLVLTLIVLYLILNICLKYLIIEYSLRSLNKRNA